MKRRACYSCKVFVYLELANRHQLEDGRNMIFGGIKDLVGESEVYASKNPVPSLLLSSPLPPAPRLCHNALFGVRAHEHDTGGRYVDIVHFRIPWFQSHHSPPHLEWCSTWILPDDSSALEI